MNNGSCEFESHLGHQKVVGATALATFSFYPYAHPESGVDGEADTTTDPLRGSCCCTHCYHQAACPCRKDTCMVFRMMRHLRCLWLQILVWLGFVGFS